MRGVGRADDAERVDVDALDFLKMLHEVWNSRSEFKYKNLQS
jgi:hypothetical protein